MKKNIKTTLITLFALLPLGMQAQSVDFSKYEGSQIANSDFETWGTEYKNVPVGWHSFESVELGTPSFLFAAAQSDKHTSCYDDDLHEGTLGKYCLKLVPRNVANIALANGTITTGRMHAGSTTASSTSNHAQMDMSVTETSNGTPYYAELSENPDYIAAWLKFISNDSENPYATISAIITDGTYYQDPENKEYTNVYAKAKNAGIVSNGGKWQRIVVPFTIQNGGITPKGILVTISTNATPGKGNENDVLYVDDLELIYTQQVTIPESGYFMMTNVAMKNHKVVIPEGITAYTLEANSEGQPKVKEVYTAGQVLPYEGAVLLEGKPRVYTFSTTLYETEEDIVAEGDICVVKSTELNTPTEEYKFFRLTTQDGQLGFYPAPYGLKIQESESLLRVKADKAAESYQHILFTPEPKGDINNDGQQSIADITALVNRLLGKQEQSNKLFIPSADVNGDNSTTISDVTTLVNILLGKGN